MLSKMLRGSVNNTTNPPAPTDANFKQVSLLLHGDGTNGAQNNTFLDSSTNNFTVTRNGNTTQGTNTPFSQAAGYWSNYFDGTNDYLGNTSFNVGANFTIEFWFYKTNVSTNLAIMLGSASTTWISVRETGPALSYAGFVRTFSTSFNLNQWNHIAFVNNTSSLTCFINGVQSGSAQTGPDATNVFFQTLIGRYGSTGYPFVGYISNVRYTNTVVYTSNFTPSTTPLTAISGTQFLTCQSNYFKDNSSNNFTLTATGTPSVQPFSPFAPTSAYSTSVNGGSEYFDGTGDYLTVATNAAFTYGVNDFTMECWVYLTTTGAIQYVIDQRNSGTANAIIPAIYVSASNVLTYFVSNAAQITGTTALKANAWYHVAVSRVTLSTKMFLNGVQEGSTYTDANSYAASRVVVASNAATAGNYLTGYVSNVRLVNGTAVYTANFTPPTAPLTAITNTSLLLSGTNAGIYDNAIKNDLETVGSAQVSTSVVKYGTGSMNFNGTTDYLTAPTSPQFAFGTGAWTIEGWIYTSSVSSAQAIVDTRATATSTAGVLLALNSSGVPIITINNATLFTSSTALTISTWTHVALVKNGTTVTLYLDGTKPATGSGTSSTSLTDQNLRIGATAGTAASFFNGYIDDLRVTKGIARYTANFTPPTAAFPNN